MHQPGVRNDTLVGREDELGVLLTRWSLASGGRGGLVAVTGDAGIGKTELVEALCDLVQTEQPPGSVAWGSCAGADGPGLWPWRSVLRSLDLGAVIDTTVDHADASAADRARLQSAIIDGVLGIAVDQPVLVVIDDLHWVDDDSLDVLRLLVGAIRHEPVLVVATMRADEPGAAAERARQLLREAMSSIDSLHLAGLSVEAVGQIVVRILGEPVDAEVVTAVADRSGGNPLFVREVTRLVRAESRVGTGGDGHPTLPPLFRDVLLRRAARLTPATRGVLDVAAVAGREVALPTLAAATGLPPSQVRGALHEAVAEGLIELHRDVLRFDHDLVREALVDSLDAEERRQWHFAIAQALEASGGTGSEPARLARHLIAAGELADPDDVADAVLRAAEASLRLRAPADAVTQVERGLDALAGAEPIGAARLHLTLGRALAAVGRWDDSVAASQRAVELSRANGDVDVLAEAALGQAGMMAHPRTDPELVQLLEEALSARGERQDGLAVQLTARLAQALVHGPGNRDRSVALSEAALQMAHELGEDGPLASALYVWLIIHLESPDFERRHRRAVEMLDVAYASGSEETEAYALHLHAHHMAEIGDYSTFDADVSACDALARRAQVMTWQWTATVHRAMRATMRGDFVEGQRLGDEAFALGTQAQHEVAGATYGAHLMVLRTWQGRLDELLSMAIASSGQYRHLPAVWASIPYIRAEMGELDEAAADLDTLLAEGRLIDLVGAQSWTVALAMLARVAGLTDRGDVARRLQSMLAGLDGRHIVGPFADCYYGPAALYRGLCAAAADDLATAGHELEEAVVAATAVGARPVAAWAAAELAVVQRRAGQTGPAEERRRSAATTLRRLGMDRHLARLEQAFGETRGSQATPDPDPANRFVRVGDGWSVSFRGRTVALRDTKGAADLHRLIQCPDDEIHVLQLTGDRDGWLSGGPAQPVLDAEAKRAYRRRLQELDDELDTAARDNDTERATRVRLERDMLIDELAAATGLGGRDRTMGHEAERARQAVRARIRYVLDRLEEVHPELHRHLRGAVTTGIMCSYRPEQPTVWQT